LSGSGKHSSLLRRGNNYSLEKFYSKGTVFIHNTSFSS
jgi:hypothetical protein